MGFSLEVPPLALARCSSLRWTPWAPLYCSWRMFVGVGLMTCEFLPGGVFTVVERATLPLKPRGRRWQLVADAIFVSMPWHAPVLRAGMSNMLRYHIGVRKLTRCFTLVVTPLWPWWSLGYMLDHDCHPMLVVWCRHHYRKVPCWCRIYVLFWCSISAEKNLLIMFFPN